MESIYHWMPALLAPHLIPRLKNQATRYSAIRCSARPARRRNWRRRARRSRRQHPIRSWWNRSRLSCAASIATSTCVAPTVVVASSCPPRPSRRCRCACCICEDRPVRDEMRSRSVRRALGVEPRQGSARPFRLARPIPAFPRARLQTSLPVSNLAHARVHFLWRPHRHAKPLTATTAALQSP